MAAFFERVLFGGCVPGPEELEAERAFVERFRPPRARPLLRARQWLRSLR